jgi:hypothetical protein
MKTITTSSYLRFVAILAIAAPLAALIGNGHWT